MSKVGFWGRIGLLILAVLSYPLVVTIYTFVRPAVEARCAIFIFGPLLIYLLCGVAVLVGSGLYLGLYGNVIKPWLCAGIRLDLRRKTLKYEKELASGSVSVASQGGELSELD